MNFRSALTFPRLMLVASALLSCTVFSSSPQGTFHPFALMASLLPLQLGALLWVKLTQSSPDLKPLANERCPQAVRSADVSGH